MEWPRFDNWIDYLTSPQFTYGALWVGLVVLTVGLMVVMRTRWGQSQPLGKCVVLSLLAHMLLAIYATTVEIVATAAPGMMGPGEPTSVRVVSVDDDQNLAIQGEPGAGSGQGSGRNARPWDVFASDLPAAPRLLEADRLDPTDISDVVRNQADNLDDLLGELSAPELLPAETTAPEPTDLAAEMLSPAIDPELTSAEPIEAPRAQRMDDSPIIPESDGQMPDRIAADSIAVSPRLSGDADLTLPDELQPISSALPRIGPETLTPATTGKMSDAAMPEDRAYSAQPADREAVGPLVPVPRARVAVRGGPGGGNAVDSIIRRGASNIGDPLGGGIGGDTSASGAPQMVLRRGGGGSGLHETPDIYKLRTAPDRSEVTEQQGGSQQTEAAVKAALTWLAANQSADGRWDASRFGSGQETKVNGRDRGGAGARADTGVTGLAILAFLGAGNTHQEGDYQDNIARALQFLVASQGSDGNLGGDAELFAFMYCHGMATLALSEAAAMTGDEQLIAPLQKAINYTLAAQNQRTGGWRYRPTDDGDTSQLGWQLMSLRSAELAGINVPARAHSGMVRFLGSVSRGKHSGLAAYRPEENVNRPMTAEALVCRQFLGELRNNATGDEAGDFLLQELPGTGRVNLYYWYYGTLGMYQLQGPHWQRWNEALSTTLVNSQRTVGDLAGTWDPADDVWGGYGGRVYTTAMGALCLEVYYRYLPLYARSSSRIQNTRTK